MWHPGSANAFRLSFPCIRRVLQNTPLICVTVFSLPWEPNILHILCKMTKYTYTSMDRLVHMINLSSLPFLEQWTKPRVSLGVQLFQVINYWWQLWSGLPVGPWLTPEKKHHHLRTASQPEPAPSSTLPHAQCWEAPHYGTCHIAAVNLVINTVINHSLSCSDSLPTGSVGLIYCVSMCNLWWTHVMQAATCCWYLFKEWSHNMKYYLFSSVAVTWQGVRVYWHTFNHIMNIYGHVSLHSHIHLFTTKVCIHIFLALRTWWLQWLHSDTFVTVRVRANIQE